MVDFIKRFPIVHCMNQRDAFSDEIQQLIFKMMGFAGLNPEDVTFDKDDDGNHRCSILNETAFIVAREVDSITPGVKTIIYDTEKSVYSHGTFDEPPIWDIDTVIAGTNIWKAVETATRLILDVQLEGMQQDWMTRNAMEEAPF